MKDELAFYEHYVKFERFMVFYGRFWHFMDIFAFSRPVWAFYGRFLFVYYIGIYYIYMYIYTYIDMYIYTYITMLHVCAYMKAVRHARCYHQSRILYEWFVIEYVYSVSCIGYTCVCEMRYAKQLSKNNRR